MSGNGKQADIAVTGLAVMGANLALNMAEKGATVAIHNRSPERIDALMDAAGPLAERFIPCRTVPELMAALTPPRPVMMMVAAGAVDAAAEGLAAGMSPGDILIDGGNANFHDTRRRVEAYTARGLQYLGVGVSGGEEGARHGPSIMIGGDAEVFRRVEPIFMSIAARYDGEPCAARLGPDGAGHFVKTIHNGIEYADMQMIAEVYGVMRDGFAMTSEEMAAVFGKWNEGRLKSYLIEITADVLAAKDPETGRPMADIIEDTAGQKGTGRWSAIEAQTLGVPATVIEAAVAARGLSARRSERLAGAALFGEPDRTLDDELGSRDAAVELLGEALLAGKIAAYAQGFAVMGQASDDYGWNLPFATIAKIWRAGCIIRSVFLDDIAQAYGAAGEARNLMTVEPFAGTLQRTEASLRRLVSVAAANGIAVPALASALAYFDLSRTTLTTANLIQGQRDYFGAHGFRRTDRDGSDFHGPWAMGLSG